MFKDMGYGSYLSGGNKNITYFLFGFSVTRGEGLSFQEQVLLFSHFLAIGGHVPYFVRKMLFWLAFPAIRGMSPTFLEYII